MKNKYIIQYYKSPLTTKTIIIPENKLVKTLRDIFNKGGHNVHIYVNESSRGKKSIEVEKLFDWTNILNG